MFSNSILSSVEDSVESDNYFLSSFFTAFASVLNIVSMFSAVIDSKSTSSLYGINFISHLSEYKISIVNDFSNVGVVFSIVLLYENYSHNQYNFQIVSENTLNCCFKLSRLSVCSFGSSALNENTSSPF